MLLQEQGRERGSQHADLVAAAGASRAAFLLLARYRHCKHIPAVTFFWSRSVHVDSAAHVHPSREQGRTKGPRGCDVSLEPVLGPVAAAGWSLGSLGAGVSRCPFALVFMPCLALVLCSAASVLPRGYKKRLVLICAVHFSKPSRVGSTSATLPVLFAPSLSS